MQRSPFSTPARALLSIIAYTAGEFDYNGLFRLTLDGAGVDSDVEEIPFPSVSYILFMVFGIIMSILLSNLLVSVLFSENKTITLFVSKSCAYLIAYHLSKYTL